MSINEDLRALYQALCVGKTLDIPAGSNLCG